MILMETEKKEEHSLHGHHKHEAHAHKKTIYRHFSLYNLFLALAVLLGIILIVNVTLTFKLNGKLDQNAEELKEKLRPAKIELAAIKNSKCPDCFDVSAAISSIKNSNVDIISHPTGRLIGKRDEYKIDFDKILKVAKETGTILEINSSPQRLDLNGFYIRRAKAEGVKMIINTDSHHKDQLNLMEYGVSQARRGWAEKTDILNTLSINKLLRYFK